MGIQSIDAEDDQFAYRYDTQLLMKDATATWMRMKYPTISQNILKETASSQPVMKT